MQLKDKTWKLFKITDLFEITGTKTTPPETLRTKNETSLEYPYITTKSDFMGVDGFFKFYTEKGNVIVIDSATDGHIHYQENNFSASDHVEKLIPKFKMNKNIGFFIVSCLKYALHEKFHYGYKLAQERIQRQTLMLPVDEDGNPDYEFMDRYIKNTYKHCEIDFTKKVQEKLDKLTYVEIENLDDKEWSEFYVHDIFEKVQRGKRLTEVNFIEGDKPYISSKSKNNGIREYIGNSEKVRIFENCLTLANSGSVGSTFYHQYSFVASDHVTHLKNENFDKYTYLFLTPMIKRLGKKYNFNREISDTRLKREFIVLPVNETGEPDYEYMKQYMINQEINLLEKYLNYVKNQNFSDYISNKEHLMM